MPSNAVGRCCAANRGNRSIPVSDCCSEPCEPKLHLTLNIQNVKIKGLPVYVEGTEFKSSGVDLSSELPTLCGQLARRSTVKL